MFTSIIGLAAAAFFKEAFADSFSGALGRTTQTLGTAGTGIQSLLTGIGTGTAQLLNPLFTLKELAGPVFGVASGGTESQAPENFGESGAQEVASSTAQFDAPKGNGTAIFSTARGTLSITDAFERITSGLSIRGTPLAPTAISRNEPTFGGFIETPTGGKREIRGSEALFQRLAQNLNR